MAKKEKEKKKKKDKKKKRVIIRKRERREREPLKSGVRAVVGIGITKAAIKHLGL